MELDHPCHEHKLSLMEEYNSSSHCFGCFQDIRCGGPVYVCETCEDEFVMHKSCAGSPPQIQRNAFHPHPLRLNFALSYEETVIVCDGCGRLRFCSLYYKCMGYGCMFNLDFQCALATLHDEEEEAESKKLAAGKIKHTVHHFSHPAHELSRCQVLWFGEYERYCFRRWWQSDCVACTENLHATSVYVCLPCRYVVHESCLNDMPTQLRTPFHPQHILLPRPIRYHDCDACRRTVEGISFCCDECNVFFHVSCARYQTRAINHNCHPDHHLLHLGNRLFIEITCSSCHKDLGDDSFFGCVKCGFFIHLECLPLPLKVLRVYHFHPLMLINYFVEDDLGCYYCDICETEMNPKHHIYYCEECSYIAHIDCVISEVKLKEQMFSHLLKGNFDDKVEIADKMNNERLEWDQTVHNEKIHLHPLTLYDDEEGTWFVCNGCGELGQGLCYRCTPCSFNLHVNCIDLIDKEDKKVTREIKTTIYHFSHPHQLTRCKISTDHEIDEYKYHCTACNQDSRGLIMYACLSCQMGIHEYCLEDMHVELRSPFHPQHLLLPAQMNRSSDYSCYICDYQIGWIASTCFRCNIFMHYSCAKYKTREIKHNCHDHHLHHLGKSIVSKGYPKCAKCDRYCGDTNLFRCIGCKFYIHPQCIPLPHLINHERHLHPLMLTNSVVEDNFETYYCDVCETKENPDLDVYHCEECNYIAHIDCVISEVELFRLNLEEILDD